VHEDFIIINIIEFLAKLDYLDVIVL